MELGVNITYEFSPITSIFSFEMTESQSVRG